MDSVTRIEKAATATRKVVAAADETRLAGPSPCDGWDGRQVLNHLVGGMQLFAAAARGKPTDAAAAGAPEFTDRLGSDPLKAYDVAAERVAAALGKPGVMQRSLTLPTGELPGVAVASIVFLELCIHGWDLGRATGRTFVLPTSLAAELESVSAAIVTDQLRVPPFFGAKKRAPKDAPVIERVAAFTGRVV